MAGRDELDELIREARAEARAAVKARLREQFECEMLEKATARLAPAAAEAEPAPESGTGVWIYCVAAAEHPGVEMDGVSEGRPTRIVRVDTLSAVVSDVPLDEFGSDGLKRNLNDLGWLEQMARAHETVLDAALAGGAVVPMRVCTIYHSEEHVREAIQKRSTDFAAALKWLGGRTEWGVKVVASRERLESAASDESVSGGAYLAGKQRVRQAREQADALLDEMVRECHARLEEWATASRLLPAQRRELAGYEGEMVLNGAYLVDDNRLDRFERVVDELRDQYRDSGLSFDLTGPWPAYHFVGRLEALEDPVS
jgi:hypothetical protein